jgi:hypothetical protein
MTSGATLAVSEAQSIASGSTSARSSAWVARNQGCHALLQTGESLCIGSAEQQRLIPTQINRRRIEPVLHLGVIRAENRHGMGR